MISVLRLGHRLHRDERLSTHCGLVARAFGATEIIFTGDHDGQLLDSITRVAERWGGPFAARYEQHWKAVITAYRKKRFAIVHLTMYGMPLQTVTRTLRKKKNMLVVIGGEKVPPELYQLADCNVAVTSQPHSEVAALAVFMHECQKGKELPKKLKHAKIKIVPQERGKKVVS